jgi:uncharacterized protein YcbK (DUF882 family)
MDRRLFLAFAAGLLAAPRPAAAVIRPPAPVRLRLANPHTGESFDGVYRNEHGPIPGVMAELSHFLRDFHCGATIAIDVGVVDFLSAVLDAAGAGRATVLSAYRTAQTNAMLARTTFGVAEHSQHILGRALDFTIDARLEPAMAAARAMRRGGVGWYPHSGFIHIDTGPVRNWDLDVGGLRDLLLFDGHHMTITADGELRISGRGTGIRRSGRPLSVAQRLSLHRQLARAEYLARHHP